MTHALLVGNPNCGKSTLFNALTGDTQRIGNWPGVTVEKKTGLCVYHDQTITMTDLPGTYSLTLSCSTSSKDEQITANIVAFAAADIIINVVDACHLERHLYLTSQLLELGKPVVVALNMMDIARQRGISIDVNTLSRYLQCPVLPMQAHQNIGIQELLETLIQPMKPSKPMALSLSNAMSQEYQRLESHCVKNIETPLLAHYITCRILEGDDFLCPDLKNTYPVAQDMDVYMADARYHAVHEMVEAVQRRQSDASHYLTARIDNIVLHRFWALPVFFSMMYLMFLGAVNVGGIFQDFFDLSSKAIFVDGTTWLLQIIHAPSWLMALLANGVGKGINTTFSFVPVIATMFFFMSLLEQSGYMARAAFVVDKVMRLLGLPGKSFVPLIVGLGCNVPAIMATRNLDSERDRLLTISMVPFMSCGARLAIYAVFVSAFFPAGGQNILFSLYIIGILMAVFTGMVLRRTVLKGQSSPLILELPPYHKPHFTRLLKETSMRLRHFLWRAGKVIIPVCVLLGGLNTLTIDGIFQASGSEHSILAWMGQCLTPLFYPLGIQQDNWPATVGLLTGMLAKEVVVGSLNTLYSQSTHMLTQVAITGSDILVTLQDAVLSIIHNLTQLGETLRNPIVARAPKDAMSHSVYGVMYQKFDGRIGAYAYLLFILLYIPCVSTMAVIRQEANRAFMWFSIVWSFILAYTGAVIFYQAATFFQHPQQTCLWTLGMVAIIGLFLVGFQAMMPRGIRYAIGHT